MSKELVISADNDGRRVDRVLRVLWPQVPLGAIMKAIRTGEVRLNGKKTKQEARLSEGDRLSLPWSDVMRDAPAAPAHAAREYPPLETLYKDDKIWIVNKPAGLLTQPDVKGGDSLITRALAELKWSRADYSPATVQRLDRNTSGAVVIALTGASQRGLAELIRLHKIRKIYHAVVEGQTEPEGRIELPLLKENSTNTVKPDVSGQPALTLYKKISSAGSNCVVEAELVTGRPHQARVHLAAIGHPIVGDTKYGKGSGAKRPLLHAYKLIFPDDASLPAELRKKTITAPLPPDILKYEN
ncbi:MAG: RluA family pseudouridine synthase [Cloacibacillus sp.]